ncbi:MAG TPA: methyltransferase domain-containing protein [Anaerolineae bacterium]|nr:methyltransferase domain-containing protein [Anaerolineae bacterium]HQH40085.1 methyltransferase domain-containing protein [Anaerolineae bacterium]
MKYDLPAPEMLVQQAEWLAPARARLLRQANIAHRKRVLDLGAGYGAVTGELARRAGGIVVAADRAVAALRANPAPFGGVYRVGGDAIRLPFAEATFDLVFTQLTLLWVHPVEPAVHEIARVLAPAGVLVAVEPDYGGMIEYPPDIAVRELWMNGFRRAGADPLIGRKLPGLLTACGFRVNVGLLDTLYAPSVARFDFLRDLPLTAEEMATLERVEQEARARRSSWAQVAHLPFFLVLAVKS